MPVLRGQRARHQPDQVDGRGRCRETPARRRRPGELIQHDAVGHRDHAAGEHQLAHDRHHQQRHDLFGGFGQRRQRQTDHRGGHRGGRDVDEQLEAAVADHRAAVHRAGTPPLAQDRDRGDDRRLDDREHGEHEYLGQQVGSGGQSDGLFPAEDRAFTDQRANGQRGAHEDGADVEHHQDLSWFVGCRAAFDGGHRDAEADVAGHRQRQHAHDERKHHQEREVAAVRHHQAHLPSRDGRQLPAHAGAGRVAQLRRREGGWLRRGRPVLGQVALVRAGRVAGDAGEDVRPVGGTHRRADLAGRTVERGHAARGQQQHLVADVEVGQRVGDDEHDAAGVGELAQHRHHLAVQRGVQAGGRFVEDQQRRAGQEFECDRGAFALPAGELVDAGVGMLGHLELFEDLRDHLGAVLFGGVRREAQLGGIHQRLVDGQFAVYHVVLGNHADPGAQRRILGMDVVAFERDGAGGRMGVAGDLPRERGLAGAGGSDHRGQRAGASGDGDVVEQRLVALDGPRQPAYVQTAGGGVGGGLGAAGQRAAVEHQVDVADRDGVAIAEQRGVDTGAVDECAVDAAVVADLGPGRGGHQRGVVSRGQHIGDDDVVVARSTDLRRPGGCLCGPARPQDPQHAGRDVAVRGPGCGGGAHHRGRLHLRGRDGLRRSR